MYLSYTRGLTCWYHGVVIDGVPGSSGVIRVVVIGVCVVVLAAANMSLTTIFHQCSLFRFPTEMAEPRPLDDVLQRALNSCPPAIEIARFVVLVHVCVEGGGDIAS